MIVISQLMALAAAGLACMFVIWNRPGWVVFGAISCAALMDCLQLGTNGLDAGINVYVDDVACLTILATGSLLTFKFRKGIPRDLTPCVLLMLLIALAFSRGYGIFGLKAAGNSARNLFAFTAPAVAIMLLRPVLRLDVGRLVRSIACAGFCLCTVALLRWAGFLPMPVELEEDLREVVRVLPSDYAIVIGQAFIAALYVMLVERGKKWLWWVAAGMFAAVTLVLQHRSVWVATVAGVAWLAFRTGRISIVRWVILVATATFALCFAMIAYPTMLVSARNLVLNDLSETQSEHSTWAWRVQGYTEATDRVFASETANMLLGPPAGWAANSGASFASIHIHSRYIDTLAYYGIVGACVLLLWFGMLIFRTRQRPELLSKMQPAIDGGQAFIQALLISELVYLVPYFGGILQGAVLGLVWVAATQDALQPRARRRTIYSLASRDTRSILAASQR